MVTLGVAGQVEAAVTNLMASLLPEFAATEHSIKSFVLLTSAG